MGSDPVVMAAIRSAVGDREGARPSRFGISASASDRSGNTRLRILMRFESVVV